MPRRSQPNVCLGVKLLLFERNSLPRSNKLSSHTLTVPHSYIMVCCGCFPFIKRPVVECGDDASCATGKDAVGSGKTGAQRDNIINAAPSGVPSLGEFAAAKAALDPFLELGNGSKIVEDECVPMLMNLAESQFISKLKSLLVVPSAVDAAGIPQPPALEFVVAVKGPEDALQRIDYTAVDASKVVRIISRCIDALLYPLIERGIDLPKRESELESQPIDLPSLIQQCKQVMSEEEWCSGIMEHKRDSDSCFGTPQAITCLCVRSGLMALGWLHGVLPDVQLETSKPIIHPGAFIVSSITTCVNVIEGTLKRPSAGMVSIATVMNGLRPLVSFLSMVGILVGMPALQTPTDDNPLSWLLYLPFFALDTAAKHSLLFITLVLSGQKRLCVSGIQRGNTIASTLSLLKKSGVLPMFGFSSNASEKKSYRLSIQFANGQGGHENGDGQGPIKEAFDSVAAEMTSQWVDVPPSVTEGSSATLLEGSSHVVLTYPSSSNLHLTIRPGYQLSFTSLSSTFNHEHFTVNDTLNMICVSVDPPEVLSAEGSSSSMQSIRVRCSSVSTVSLHRSQYLLYQPVVPMFKAERNNPSVWFNLSIPELGDCPYSATEHQDAWVEKYAFVGWLMAQAIANGVTLPLSLPTAFFDLLKHWSLFQSTESIVTEDHLRSIGDGSMSLKSVYDMSPETLKEVASLQGLPSDTTHAQYIKHLCQEMIVNQVRLQMSAIVDAFGSCGLRSSLVLRHTSPCELRNMICGRSDDVTSDYSLRIEFRILEDPDLHRYRHSIVFLECLWDVVDDGLDEHSEHIFYTAKRPSANKRRFLKFVTGRKLLPAIPQQETFRIVSGSNPMCAAAYDQLLHRLPSAHTCDNTLDVPNYAEAVLFRSTSPWFDLPGSPPVSGTIANSHRETAWDQLCQASPDTIEAMRTEIRTIIRNKLLHAICNADTYDLD